MNFRTHLAAVAAILLGACQSVRTQDNPPATLDQPVTLSLAPDAPSATPAPTSTPAPTPRPAAKPQYTYNSVPGVGPAIAITFDDGPNPKLTPMLLDMLKQRKIKATFFVVGKNAAEYPDILKRMVAEGHEIGNHSWSHPSLTGLGAAGVGSQMERTNAAVRAAVGKDPVVMRPPYGATNAALNRRYNEAYGMKVILWSVDPQDWKYRNAERVKRTILEQTQPGGIILVHDIHPSSVAAMPGTLDGLLARGFKFATVSELIAMQDAQAVQAPAAAPANAPVNAITAPTATPFSVERYEPTSEGSAAP